MLSAKESLDVFSQENASVGNYKNSDGNTNFEEVLKFCDSGQPKPQWHESAHYIRN